MCFRRSAKQLKHTALGTKSETFNNCTSPVHTASHIKPEHRPIFYKTHFSIILHLLLGFRSGLFPSGPPISLAFSTRASCITQFVFLQSIMPRIFRTHQKDLRSPLCNFLRAPVTSFLCEISIQVAEKRRSLEHRPTSLRIPQVSQNEKPGVFVTPAAGLNDTAFFTTLYH